MRRKRVRTGTTIVDIARTLGVSAMTVSRALTGNPEVAAETRERVRKCAEMLGYRPNRWARSLVTQRSAIIGIIVPDIAHSYFAEITRGVEEVLDKAGFDLLLCHSGLDAQKERAEMEMLIESQVDGLVVASEQPERDPGHILELQRRRIPFVLVDRFFPEFDFPAVRVNDRRVGRLATEYLISLGHRRIAHIQGPAFSPSSLRRRGYLDAMKAAELTDERNSMATGRFNLESGVEAMLELLETTPRPTAIFAANDPMAIGAAHACLKAGLRIPEDISIIGAGNIEGSYHPNPFLTTIDWPRQELGRAAATHLLASVLSPDQPRDPIPLLAPQLLVRQSTGPLKSKRRPTKR